MRCPFCSEDNDKVIDSRSAEAGKVIRRRRVCQACERRFTTYERIEEAIKLTVVKKDGSRVPYDRSRLAAGIEKACYKRPVSATRLGKVVETIEDELYKTFDKEVDSSEIGHLASEHLKRVDQIAYVRYASVYKQFRDIDDLLDEVRDVIESGGSPDVVDQGKLF